MDDVWTRRRNKIQTHRHGITWCGRPHSLRYPRLRLLTCGNDPCYRHRTYDGDRRRRAPIAASSRERTFIRRRLASRLERRGEDDGEDTRTEDTGEGDRPVDQVTFVLVTVALEVLRGPDRGVFIDVRLAVLQAELVHVASLAGSPTIVGNRESPRQSLYSSSFASSILIFLIIVHASSSHTRAFLCQPSSRHHLVPITIRAFIQSR